MIANEFQIIALQTSQLHKEYSEGMISDDEYKELIYNIGTLTAFNDDAMNLEENIVYSHMIKSAIDTFSNI